MSLFLLAGNAMVVGLLWKLLYLVLAIGVLGAVVWAIQYFIGPLPRPVLVVLAIVVLILAAIYLLGGGGLL